MRYLVYDNHGELLETFHSEKERTRWLKTFCYFSGTHWMVYDFPSFPHNVMSRTLYLTEE